MDEDNNCKPTIDSLRMAMEFAWHDHHYARDQTWRTVQMVAVLAAGLVTVDFAHQNILATSLAGILVIVAGAFSVGITWNHRTLEIRKFVHPMNCEELLGLHQGDIIPLWTNVRISKQRLLQRPISQNLNIASLSSLAR